MNLIDKENWTKCVAFHGHECGGLATGFRIAGYAKKVLEIDDNIDDEDIVCVAETEACAVDAIQVMLKATTGTGALLIDFKGKNAYTIFNRKNGRSARFLMIYKRDGTLTKKERMDKILEASDAELFAISDAKQSFPERASLYESIICENCGELTADICIKKVSGKSLCGDCAKSV